MFPGALLGLMLLLVWRSPLADYRDAGYIAGIKPAGARHLALQQQADVTVLEASGVVAHDQRAGSGRIMHKKHPNSRTRVLQSSRALQQEAVQNEVNVSIVMTAEDLQMAFKSGAAHVEIRAHLDLTTLPLVNSMLLGEVPSTMKTVRVCC